MVYSTQNYWISGLFRSSEILNTENNTFHKLGLFPFSGDEREKFVLLNPLERADLIRFNHEVSKRVGPLIEVSAF
jgi:hypothetical protein